MDVHAHVYVLNIVVHKLKEINDNVSVPPDGHKGQGAQVLEALKVNRVQATHALDHFPAQLHRGREGLWVTAKDKCKVNVKQLAFPGEEQVVQMPITDSQ